MLVQLLSLLLTLLTTEPQASWWLALRVVYCRHYSCAWPLVNVASKKTWTAGPTAHACQKSKRALADEMTSLKLDVSTLWEILLRKLKIATANNLFSSSSICRTDQIVPAGLVTYQVRTRKVSRCSLTINPRQMNAPPMLLLLLVVLHAAYSCIPWCVACCESMYVGVDRCTAAAWNFQAGRYY